MWLSCLSSHLKEADYKCGYVLLFHYSVLTFPKSKGTNHQEFLGGWGQCFWGPPHSETMWLFFTVTHPSQEGVKDTTNGNLHQKFHNKMLWGRKQSYLYIWKYLNLIRFNLSVGGHCASHGPQNTNWWRNHREMQGVFLSIHKIDGLLHFLSFTSTWAQFKITYRVQ